MPWPSAVGYSLASFTPEDGGGPILRHSGTREQREGQRRSAIPREKAAIGGEERQPGGGGRRHVAAARRLAGLVSRLLHFTRTRGWTGMGLVYSNWWSTRLGHYVERSQANRKRPFVASPVTDGSRNNLVIFMLCYFGLSNHGSGFWIVAVSRHWRLQIKFWYRKILSSYSATVKFILLCKCNNQCRRMQWLSWCVKLTKWNYLISGWKEANHIPI